LINSSPEGKPRSRFSSPGKLSGSWQAFSLHVDFQIRINLKRNWRANAILSLSANFFEENAKSHVHFFAPISILYIGPHKFLAAEFLPDLRTAS
jgi:hypothetical protein